MGRILQIESLVHIIAMVVRWLAERQTSRTKCCIRTTTLMREMSKSLVFQSLSSFFPYVGSISNTVILGYTSCGNYIVALQNGLIIMFSLVLSLKKILIGPEYKALKVRTSQEVSQSLAVVEVMSLRSNPYICAALIVSVEECATQSKVYCGRFRGFWQERLIINEESFGCTLRNNSMYSYGCGTDDVAILMNTGSGLTFYLVLGSAKSQLTRLVSQAASDFAHLSQSHDLQSFSAKKKRWHSLSCAEHNNIATSRCSPLTSLTVVRSAVNLELFVDEYLHSIHPTAYQRGSQFDLEFRAIGPCDSGTEFLCILGISFTHLQAGLQSVGVLLILHPLVDQIAVLKVSDLAALCNTNNSDFTSFRRQLKQKRVSEDMSWLSTAVDFYAHIVRTSYNGLLFGCRLVKDRHNNSIPYCVLSNINMVLNGESMTHLTHPFVPVVVVNDEEETQSEEILFNSEDL